MLDSNKNYEAALLSLDPHNSIPNVSVNKNNIFTYSTDKESTWKTVAINTGAYEHKKCKGVNKSVVEKKYNAQWLQGLLAKWKKTV